MISPNGLRRLGFVPEKDFVMRDDGNGPYIEDWRSSSDRPTMADMEIAHAEWESQAASNIAAKKDRLDSVRAKLEAIGLTSEEIQDAFGI